MTWVERGSKGKLRSLRAGPGRDGRREVEDRGDDTRDPPGLSRLGVESPDDGEYDSSDVSERGGESRLGSVVERVAVGDERVVGSVGHLYDRTKGDGSATGISEST